MLLFIPFKTNQPVFWDQLEQASNFCYSVFHDLVFFLIKPYAVLTYVFILYCINYGYTNEIVFVACLYCTKTKLDYPGLIWYI